MSVLKYDEFVSLNETNSVSDEFLNEGIFDFLKKNKEVKDVKKIKKAGEIIAEKIKSGKTLEETEINKILDDALNAVKEGKFQAFKKNNKGGLDKVRFYFQKYGKPFGVGVLFGVMPILFIIAIYATVFGDKRFTSKIENYMQGVKAAANKAGIDPHSGDILKIDMFKNEEDALLNGGKFMDNENIDNDEENLNESILISAYIVAMAGVISTGLLAQLVLALDKKVKIKKMLLAETDPAKKAKYKEELKGMNHHEVTLRNKLRKLKEKHAGSKEDAKTKVTPKELEKAKIQVAKYEGKIKALTSEYAGLK